VSAIREWFAAHLAWITIALLCAWAPPVLYAVAVNLTLVQASGFPGWRDPVFVLSIVEMALMFAAIHPLMQRAPAGWWRLLWSRVAVALQTLWIVALNSRLNGLVPALTTRPIVEALIGLVVAGAVLWCVRPLFAPRRNDVVHARVRDELPKVLVKIAADEDRGIDR
jgi:hypothetical protein